MKVAIYLRVSRIDLHPENQKIELEHYAKAQGWDYTIYEEKESTRKTRPIKLDILNQAYKRQIDIILVYKLDRWARSLQELIGDFNNLQRHKVEFRSLKDNIILNEDPRNMLMIHILGAFAEFEREMIRERTMAGLARARAQGKKLGRPLGSNKKKSPPVEAVKNLLAQAMDERDIAKTLETSRYRVRKVIEKIKEGGNSGGVFP